MSNHAGQSATSDKRTENSTRALAARVLTGVLDRHWSLDQSFEKYLADTGLSGRDHGFVKALCYEACRQGPRLDFYLDRLLTDKRAPLPALVRSLLWLGLVQLTAMETAQHAAVNETVAATRALRLPKHRALVNAILRRFQRERLSLEAAAESDAVAKWAHPQWLIDAIKKDWPEHWQRILEANNQPPPLWLRVNQQQTTLPSYIVANGQALGEFRTTSAAQHALMLTERPDVTAIPGFFEGQVSVQDLASQWVTQVAMVKPGQLLLDACAAPGGKLCALLEVVPTSASLEATAVDIDTQRLQQVKENLQRLGLQANTVAADATKPGAWARAGHYDWVLLDAPCTATGVIRRHPDIKLRRKPRQLAQAGEQQQRLFKALWPLVKPGGFLVYSTCSVLRAENDSALKACLAKVEDASVSPLSLPAGLPTELGWQLLPGDVPNDLASDLAGDLAGDLTSDLAGAGTAGCDGFFYARVQKNKKN